MGAMAFPETFVGRIHAKSAATSREQPGMPKGARRIGSGIDPHACDERPISSMAVVPGGAPERKAPKVGFPAVAEGFPPAARIWGVDPDVPGHPEPKSEEPAGIPV